MAESIETIKRKGASKKLKACMNCSRLETNQTFKTTGCPNCPFLEYHRKSDNLYDGVSDSYQGMIWVIKPEQSWVAKWQRLNKYKEGLYAMTVEGVMPDNLIDKIERNGQTYFQRDFSFKI
ncbi:Transcription elongation factor SPT4 [Astathelohania contejeani]|uniref:Transcription elongation factor SPT4 n=1 Tax=Astathelohania contejeani TaxID=164912 RepID=A0ABQ7HXN5_9MICR|nr:Transcription elongation factor SPT4 [Thelohania contejeani]